MRQRGDAPSGGDSGRRSSRPRAAREAPFPSEAACRVAARPRGRRSRRDPRRRPSSRRGESSSCRSSARGARRASRRPRSHPNAPETTGRSHQAPLPVHVRLRGSGSRCDRQHSSLRRPRTHCEAIMTEPFAGCPRITGRPSLRRARIPRLCKRLQDPDRMWRRTCSGGETPTRHAILKEADFQRSRNPVWAFPGSLVKRKWLRYAKQPLREPPDSPGCSHTGPHIASDRRTRLLRREEIEQREERRGGGAIAELPRRRRTRTPAAGLPRRRTASSPCRRPRPRSS